MGYTMDVRWCVTTSGLVSPVSVSVPFSSKETVLSIFFFVCVCARYKRKIVLVVEEKGVGWEGLGYLTLDICPRVYVCRS